MKTSIFIDPSSTHDMIAELNEAKADHDVKFPLALPGHFTYKGEMWYETVNGFHMTINRSIRELPLLLKDVPIHRIELEDSIEDPNGTIQLAQGIYIMYSARAEVDSYLYRNSFFVYTIKIENPGDKLEIVNAMYRDIRQGKAVPTEPWVSAQ